jgi:PKD repeat protein
MRIARHLPLIHLLVASCLLSTAYATDYIIGIDLSGSMKQPLDSSQAPSPQRIQRVKERLAEFIQKQPKGVEIEFIAFNNPFDQGRVPGPVATFELDSASDRQAATQWIQRLNVPGNAGTALWDSFGYALERVKAIRSKNPHSWTNVIFYTDGVDENSVRYKHPDQLRDAYRDLLVDLRMMPQLVLMGSIKNPSLAEKRKGHTRDSEDYIDSVDDSSFEVPLPPVIVFEPDPILVGQPVSFFENSANPFRSYKWSLDGKTVTDGAEKRFRYTFTKEGNYLVRVEAERMRGGISVTTRAIQVIPNRLSAEIINPGLVITGQPCNISSRAVGKDPKYVWKVDGKTVGTEQDLKAYTFTKPGPKQVRLEVTDAFGKNESAEMTLTVRSEKLSAEIIEPGQLIAGQPCNIASRAIGEDLRYAWKVDGKAVGTEQDLKAYTFKDPGAKVVRLEITDALRKTESAEITVTVVAPPPEPDPPVAKIRAPEGTHKANDTIEFVDESTGLIKSWSWDFNGEFTKTDKNPEVKFGTAGAKKIILTVTGPGGTDKAETTIKVLPQYNAPTLKLKKVKTSGTIPFTTELSAEAEGDYAKIIWTLPDGSTKEGESLSYEVSTAGDGNVTVKVIPKDPAHETPSESITISAKEPTPAWVWWLIAAVPIVILLAVLLAKMKPKPVYGRLSWISEGGDGSQFLKGTEVDLASDLEIEGWEPEKTYLLRNKGGMKLYADGQEIQSLQGQDTFELEGVEFTYETQVV